MCICNPLIKTPWCGKPGCGMPPQPERKAEFKFSPAFHHGKRFVTVQLMISAEFSGLFDASTFADAVQTFVKEEFSLCHDGKIK
jgi:hypothetical protein